MSRKDSRRSTVSIAVTTGVLALAVASTGAVSMQAAAVEGVGASGDDRTVTRTNAAAAPMSFDQAGDAQKYACRSFGSFPAYNKKSDVEAGFFSWPAGRKAKVGTGQNINWKANPYKDDSWRTWFHGMMWMGSLVESSTRGITANRDPKAIDRAVALAQDWTRDNKYPWPTGPGAGNATHTRVDALACLRAGLIQLGKPVPKWLDTSLVQHAEWLKKNTWKDHNVGTEQTLAVLGIGCMVGRNDYKLYATHKLSNDITKVIDAQGANNEQSPGYARWNWDIWGDVEEAISTCGVVSKSADTIKHRRAALAQFLDHATKPDGYLAAIGDTKRETAQTGTAAQQWIASNGASGAPLRERVKVYNAGYVFGRSGWGTSGRKPNQESMYSLHFGPVRLGHGHNDHMGITWNTKGREILADSGTGQYNNDAWRDYYTGPSAHNQLVVPRMKTSQVTALTRSTITPKADYFQMQDQPLKEVKRVRNVIFLSDPDIAITVDGATSTIPTSFTQTWHLPYNQAVKVSGSTAVATTPKVAGKTTVLSLPIPGAPKTSYGHVKGSTKPIQGWQWVDHFTKYKASVLTATQSGKSARIATAFVASGSSDRVTMKSSGNAKAMTYTFTVGKQTAVVRLDADGTLTRLK
ncbi:MAG: heparinase II/III family protein [Dermatophilus congolensis]|nr:heparinase II/III family protein [Dermatophilus congolensis]